MVSCGIGKNEKRMKLIIVNNGECRLNPRNLIKKCYNKENEPIRQQIFYSDTWINYPLRFFRQPLSNDILPGDVQKSGRNVVDNLFLAVKLLPYWPVFFIVILWMTDIWIVGLNNNNDDIYDAFLVPKFWINCDQNWRYRRKKSPQRAALPKLCTSSVIQAVIVCKYF